MASATAVQPVRRAVGGLLVLAVFLCWNVGGVEARLKNTVTQCASGWAAAVPPLRTVNGLLVVFTVHSEHRWYHVMSPAGVSHSAAAQALTGSALLLLCVMLLLCVLLLLFVVLLQGSMRRGRLLAAKSLPTTSPSRSKYHFFQPRPARGR